VNSGWPFDFHFCFLSRAESEMKALSLAERDNFRKMVATLPVHLYAGRRIPSRLLRVPRSVITSQWQFAATVDEDLRMAAEGFHNHIPASRPLLQVAESGSTRGSGDCTSGIAALESSM